MSTVLPWETKEEKVDEVLPWEQPSSTPAATPAVSPTTTPTSALPWLTQPTVAAPVAPVPPPNLPLDVLARIEDQVDGPIDNSLKNLILAHYTTFGKWPDFSLTADILTNGEIKFDTYEGALSFFESVKESYAGTGMEWKLDASRTMGDGRKIVGSEKAIQQNGIFTAQSDILDPEMIASFRPEKVEDFLFGPYIKRTAKGKETMWRDSRLRLDELLILAPKQWAISQLGTSLDRQAVKINPDRNADEALMVNLNKFIASRLPQDQAKPTPTATWQPETEEGLKYLQMMRATALYVASAESGEPSGQPAQEAASFLSMNGYGDILTVLDQQIRMASMPSGSTPEEQRKNFDNTAAWIEQMYIGSRNPGISERMALHELHDINPNAVTTQSAKQIGTDGMKSRFGALVGWLGYVPGVNKLDDLWMSDAMRPVRALVPAVVGEISDVLDAIPAQPGRVFGVGSEVSVRDVAAKSFDMLGKVYEYADLAMVTARQMQGQTKEGISGQLGTTALLQAIVPTGPVLAGLQFGTFKATEQNAVDQRVIRDQAFAEYLAVDQKGRSGDPEALGHFLDRWKFYWHNNQDASEAGIPMQITDELLRETGLDPLQHPELSFVLGLAADSLQDGVVLKGAGLALKAAKATKPVIDVLEKTRTTLNIMTTADVLTSTAERSGLASAEALSKPDEFTAGAQAIFGFQHDEVVALTRNLERGVLQDGTKASMHDIIYEAIPKMTDAGRGIVNPDSWAIWERAHEIMLYNQNSPLYRGKHPFATYMLEKTHSQRKFSLKRSEADRAAARISSEMRTTIGKNPNGFLHTIDDEIQATMIAGEEERLKVLYDIKESGDINRFADFLAGRYMHADVDAERMLRQEFHVNKMLAASSEREPAMRAHRIGLEWDDVKDLDEIDRLAMGIRARIAAKPDMWNHDLGMMTEAGKHYLKYMGKKKNRALAEQLKDQVEDYHRSRGIFNNDGTVPRFIPLEAERRGWQNLQMPTQDRIPTGLKSQEELMAEKSVEFMDIEGANRNPMANMLPQQGVIDDGTSNPLVNRAGDEQVFAETSKAFRYDTLGDVIEVEQKLARQADEARRASGLLTQSEVEQAVILLDSMEGEARAYAKVKRLASETVEDYTKRVEDGVAKALEERDVAIARTTSATTFKERFTPKMFIPEGGTKAEGTRLYNENLKRTVDLEERATRLRHKEFRSNLDAARADRGAMNRALPFPEQSELNGAPQIGVHHQLNDRGMPRSGRVSGETASAMYEQRAYSRQLKRAQSLGAQRLEQELPVTSTEVLEWRKGAKGATNGATRELSDVVDMFTKDLDPEILNEKGFGFPDLYPLFAAMEGTSEERAVKMIDLIDSLITEKGYAASTFGDLRSKLQNGLNRIANAHDYEVFLDDLINRGHIFQRQNPGVGLEPRIRIVPRTVESSGELTFTPKWNTPEGVRSDPRLALPVDMKFQVIEALQEGKKGRRHALDLITQFIEDKMTHYRIHFDPKEGLESPGWAIENQFKWGPEGDRAVTEGRDMADHQSFDPLNPPVEATMLADKDFTLAVKELMDSIWDAHLRGEDFVFHTTQKVSKKDVNLAPRLPGPLESANPQQRLPILSEPVAGETWRLGDKYVAGWVDGRLKIVDQTTGQVYFRNPYVVTSDASATAGFKNILESPYEIRMVESGEEIRPAPLDQPKIAPTHLFNATTLKYYEVIEKKTGRVVDRSLVGERPGYPLDAEALKVIDSKLTKLRGQTKELDDELKKLAPDEKTQAKLDELHKRAIAHEDVREQITALLPDKNTITKLRRKRAALIRKQNTLKEAKAGSAAATKRLKESPDFPFSVGTRLSEKDAADLLDNLYRNHLESLDRKAVAEIINIGQRGAGAIVVRGEQKSVLRTFLDKFENQAGGTYIPKKARKELERPLGEGGKPEHLVMAKLDAALQYIPREKEFGDVIQGLYGEALAGFVKKNISTRMPVRWLGPNGELMARDAARLRRPQVPLTAEQVANIARRNGVSRPPMNIWYGSGENAGLSNLAPRPFTYDGVKYKSVEHAFQSLKGGSLNETVYRNEAWNRGGRAVRGTVGKLTDAQLDTLMHDLIVASYKENPKALEELLATTGTKLTHRQGGRWAGRFPKILMQVRDELGGGKATGQGIDLTDMVAGKKVQLTPQEFLRRKAATLNTLRSEGERLVQWIAQGNVTKEPQSKWARELANLKQQLAQKRVAYKDLRDEIADAEAKLGIKAPVWDGAKWVDVESRDIFDGSGIPIIPTNLPGVHGKGIALAAKEKGLLPVGKGAMKDSLPGAVMFPTKVTWREKADLALIESSFKDLGKVVDARPDENFLLPRVGMGLGGLEESDVMPLIDDFLSKHPNVRFIDDTVTEGPRHHRPFPGRDFEPGVHQQFTRGMPRGGRTTGASAKLADKTDQQLRDEIDRIIGGRPYQDVSKADEVKVNVLQAELLNRQGSRLATPLSTDVVSDEKIAEILSVPPDDVVPAAVPDPRPPRVIPTEEDILLRDEGRLSPERHQELARSVETVANEDVYAAMDEAYAALERNRLRLQAAVEEDRILNQQRLAAQQRYENAKAMLYGGVVRGTTEEGLEQYQRQSVLLGVAGKKAIDEQDAALAYVREVTASGESVTPVELGERLRVMLDDVENILERIELDPEGFRTQFGGTGLKFETEAAMEWQLKEWHYSSYNYSKLSKFYAGGFIKGMEKFNAWKMPGVNVSLDDMTTLYKTLVMAKLSTMIRIPLADEASRFITEGINPITAWKRARQLKDFDKMPDDIQFKVSELIRQASDGTYDYITYGAKDSFVHYQKMVALARRDPTYSRFLLGRMMLDEAYGVNGRTAMLEQVNHFLATAGPREKNLKTIVERYMAEHADTSADFPDEALFKAWYSLGYRKGGGLRKTALGSHRVVKMIEKNQEYFDVAVQKKDAYYANEIENATGGLAEPAAGGSRLNRKTGLRTEGKGIRGDAQGLVDGLFNYYTYFYDHPILGKHWRPDGGWIGGVKEAEWAAQLEKGVIPEDLMYGKVYDGLFDKREAKKAWQSIGQLNPADAQITTWDGKVIDAGPNKVRSWQPVLFGQRTTNGSLPNIAYRGRDFLYSVLDYAGSKMNEMVYANAFTENVDSLTAAARKGLKRGEKLTDEQILDIERKAHFTARGYMERVMFTNVTYGGEEFLRNLVMFLPAYRQFATYWAPYLATHPFALAFAYHLNKNKENLKMRVGDFELNFARMSFLVNGSDTADYPWKQLTGFLPSGAPLLTMPVSYGAHATMDDKDSKWGQLAGNWPFEFAGEYTAINSPFDKLVYGVTGHTLPWPFGTDPTKNAWRAIQIQNEALVNHDKRISGGDAMWKVRVNRLIEGGWNFVSPVGVRIVEEDTLAMMEGRIAYNKAKTPLEVQQLLAKPEMATFKKFMIWQNLPSDQQLDYMSKNPGIVPYAVSGYAAGDNPSGAVGLLYSQAVDAGVPDPETYVTRVDQKYTMLNKVLEAERFRQEKYDEEDWWKEYKKTTPSAKALEAEWKSSTGAFAPGGSFYTQGRRGKAYYDAQLNSKYLGISDPYTGISSLKSDSYLLAQFMDVMGGASRALLQKSPNYPMYLELKKQAAMP